MGTWIEKAACRDLDPEIFFPIGAAPAVSQLRQARRICGACSVRGQCLRYALETGQQAGIWGGATEGERRAMREEVLHGARI
ncbi:WhiB family transcriptional regulator [Microtetraspora sp. NBRC 13810]|uniref:WhiB family transcriptional regulator n=1 Tax=Microtetraspora sp. NBRC 13810 TaxID=3030990 RepID=UPI002555EF90|nr:WhiB family transcriptional regulator [Microtetraspora sp. NBRC 13810]